MVVPPVSPFGGDPEWNQQHGWVSMWGAGFVTAPPLGVRSLVGDQGYHRRIEVTPRGTFGFDGRALGSPQSVPLATRVDVAEMTRLTLAVRVHAISNWSATATASIVVYDETVDRTDESVVLVGTKVLAQVGLTSSTATPSLFVVPFLRPPADRIRVLLVWEQGDSAGTLQQVTLGVEIVGDACAPVDGGVLGTLRRLVQDNPERARTLLGGVRIVAATAGGILREVTPKQKLVLAAEGTEEIVLAKNIDVSDFGALSLVVRLHDKSTWTSGETCAIRILNESVAPSSPSEEMVNATPLARVDIDASTPVPGLLIADTHELTPVGARVRVALEWAQPAAATTVEDLTISVDLLGRLRSREFAATDLEGCILWLRADRHVALTSGRVSNWGDGSEGNNDFVQSTASARPAFNYSDANFNGRPTLSFDGAAYHLDVASTFTAPTEAHTFWVMRAMADPPGSVVQTGWEYFGSSTSASHYPFTSGEVYAAFATSSRRTLSSPAQDLTRAHFTEIMSSSSSYDVFIGGVQEFTGAGAFGWNTSPTIGESRGSTRWFWSLGLECEPHERSRLHECGAARDERRAGQAAVASSTGAAPMVQLPPTLPARSFNNPSRAEANNSEATVTRPGRHSFGVDASSPCNECRFWAVKSRSRATVRP